MPVRSCHPAVPLGLRRTTIDVLNQCLGNLGGTGEWGQTKVAGQEWEMNKNLMSAEKRAGQSLAPELYPGFVCHADQLPVRGPIALPLLEGRGLG